MSEAERSIEVDAPLETVFGVITDYEAYPEFLPELHSVTVLEREPGRARVRFVLHVVKTVRYTLELTESAPFSVRWTLVEGDLRQNAGSWTLERHGAGTRASYSVRVEVGVFVPGAIVSRLVGETLPATLQAFRVRAESRS